MLANGWGVAVDIGKAVELFHRAVAVGEPAGWVGLGYVQYYGLGQVVENKTAALEMYRRGAEAGDAQVTRLECLLYHA